MGILPLSHLCSSYFMMFLVFCGKEQAQGSSQAGAPSGQLLITPRCPSAPGTHPSGSEGCRPRCTVVRKRVDEAHPGPRHPTLQGPDTVHPQRGNAGCCDGGCGCVVTVQASLSDAAMGGSGLRFISGVSGSSRGRGDGTWFHRGRLLLAHAVCLSCPAVVVVL